MSAIYQDYLNSRKANENLALELLAKLAKLASNEVKLSFFGDVDTVDVADILAKHTKAG